MPIVYRLGDLFIMPSAAETWGIAVNEALACGRPVVVSDCVGCAEDLVEPGADGWVFPAGDVGALAAALRQALAPGVDLRGMGERGREVGSRYHYRHTVAGLADCLGALFPSRHGAARLCGSDG